MTCKVVNRPKFSTISSENADTLSPYCQQVELHVDLLFASPSYVEPRPDAGI